MILGISVELGVIVSTVTAVAYTLVGGLFAVAYVDIVQLITVGLGLVSHLHESWQPYYGHLGSSPAMRRIFLNKRQKKWNLDLT